jgi:hypothetical protein
MTPADVRNTATEAGMIKMRPNQNDDKYTDQSKIYVVPNSLSPTYFGIFFLPLNRISVYGLWPLATRLDDRLDREWPTRTA